ncbi:hypothetical protein [Rossellomorea vietnamensis]|jgi:hypothetical protein|uniref:Uncharacterized protein n=1 Tax=Rossellomorea vietnamensis TaxID=218284 RepID=A0A0P6WSG0_9BACI|nr:hypothetical protein [Rossellomorea vietnamensis]KPL60564.1 hypothetical protein AM506_05435 [Rossellomorea vietnamensis]
MDRDKKSEKMRMDTPLNPEFTMNDRLRNPSQVYVPGESLEEHHAVEEGNGVIAEKVIGQANENG